MSGQQFESVWDVIADSPWQAAVADFCHTHENLKGSVKMRTQAFLFFSLVAVGAHAANNVKQLETEKFCSNVAALGADAYERKRSHQDPPDFQKWHDRPIIKWALDYGYRKADSREDALKMSRAYCMDQTN